MKTIPYKCTFRKKHSIDRDVVESRVYWLKHYYQQQTNLDLIFFNIASCMVLSSLLTFSECCFGFIFLVISKRFVY